MAKPRRRRPDRAIQYESAAFRDWQLRVAGNARRLRGERGWTQEEASEACGLGFQHYQTIEAGRGNLTLTTLARLSKGFGVEPVDLVAAVSRPKRRPPGRPRRD